MQRSWMIVAAMAASVAACGPNTSQQPAAKTAAKSTPAPTRDAVAPGDWPLINRTLAANRYSPLTDINADNVRNLETSWTFQLGGNSTAVPIVVGGVMYVPSRDRIVALDGDTGATVWTYVLPSSTPPSGSAPGPGPGGPGGPGRRRSNRVDARSALLARRRHARAPDPVHEPRESRRARRGTGKPSAGFGTDGAADVGVPYGGTPTIYRNIAIIGAATGEVPQGPPGNPRAFDVRTGAKLWDFQTVPKAGEPFNDTWGNGWKDRGGTNVWAFAAPIDAESGPRICRSRVPRRTTTAAIGPVTICSATRSSRSTRRPANTSGTSKPCITISGTPTCRRPALVRLRANGQRVPAIAQVGKSGFFYPEPADGRTVDRRRGEARAERRRADRVVLADAADSR